MIKEKEKEAFELEARHDAQLVKMSSTSETLNCQLAAQKSQLEQHYANLFAQVQTSNKVIFISTNVTLANKVVNVEFKF